MAGLLLTRPRAAAEQFAADLDAQTRAGLIVIVAPLIETCRTGPVGTGSCGRDVIFSSANAVRYAAAPLSDQQAYCVGQRTVEAARAFGWQADYCGQDADGLIATLTDAPPMRPLVHMHGTHTRGNIAARLRAAGMDCDEQVIYDQPTLSYNKDARLLIDAQVSLIVPLFSPRTAAQFVKLAPYLADLYLIALSSAVAGPLKGLNCKDLRICKAPTGDNMQDLVRDAAVALARVEGGSSAQ
ncbi:uroporphyrinogen-III synthase [Phaeobacter porticola]|uniref:Uoporphyrinogen-III synthase HemD-like protein n=1 Tax=Phaeobacter porticola TaxID=1844006 RepID=A0A1L3I954_9RHOB|nr:uroporphyrinogen-III synthase [Phaeobacter porticola]APG48749.1 uoporphyrinogen-III synthase HemD-like protein [Phaeobacter porticola]